MAEVIRIGPYRPALLEPELYEVTVEDNRVTNVEIKPGYVHRGIEKLMTTKTYQQNIFLCERVCGICSHAHTSCYCQAVERILDIEVPERAKYIRTFVAELERLHSHYLWFAMLSHTLHQVEHFLKILDARERIMDLFELVCGNRVHYAINTFGGVRKDLNPLAIKRTKETLDELKALSGYVVKTLKRGSFRSKLTGIGVLTKKKALALGVVGPVLRASGVRSDIRKDDPYAAYEKLNFEIPVEKTGDVYARALVRAEETRQSIGIVQQLLDELPSGDISAEIGEPAEGEEVGRVEAPRGELVYYIRSNGTNIPARVKIRTPTFMNEYSLFEALLDEKLGDVPLILESIDPCISCAERLTIIDQRTGKKRWVRLLDLA